MRYVAALSLGFVGGVGVVVAERFLAPPAIVAAIDLQSLVADRITRADVVGLPDAARLEDAEQFAARLEQEVGRLARDHGALLIAAPAVLAGAPDLTDVLRAQLELHEKSPGERRDSR